MQGKKKKISFKLFLHKASPSKDGARYPLHLRVTYNRQNTKVSDIIFNYHSLLWDEDDLARFNKGDWSGAFKKEANQVTQALYLYEKIIRYEESFTKNYSISGLVKRVRFYRYFMIDEFNSLISHFLNMEQDALTGDSLSENRMPLSLNLLNNYWDKFLTFELSETSKRMIETYSLVYLFESPNCHDFNDKNNQYIGTNFHWIIGGGFHLFEKFLHDYFGERKHINESEIKNIIYPKDGVNSGITTLMKRNPPNKKYLSVYLTLLKNHLKEASKRK